MATYVITPEENGFNEEKFKNTQCYKHILDILKYAAMEQYPAIITIDVASGSE